MAIPIIGDLLDGLLGTAGDLISEVVVDKDKKLELELKLKQLEDLKDQRLHDELMGQVEINKVEAAHPSIFIAGWRPAIGWIGAASLSWTFILAPLIETVARFFGWVGAMPELDSTLLMTLVTSMLGIGAMRSYDKKNDTATVKMSKN